MPNNGNSRKCAVRFTGTSPSMKRIFLLFLTYLDTTRWTLEPFVLEREGINCIAKDRKRRISQKGGIRALGHTRERRNVPFSFAKDDRHFVFFFVINNDTHDIFYLFEGRERRKVKRRKSNTHTLTLGKFSHTSSFQFVTSASGRDFCFVPF